MEIKIGPTASVRIERQGQWVILWVNDGVAQTTISLEPKHAFDIAKLLKGSGVSAAVCDCGAETEGKWAGIHGPGCVLTSAQADGAA